MSVPALSNVRLISILAASLLAGYAGDEAYNVWWQPDQEHPAELASVVLPQPGPQRTLENAEPATVALAPQPIRGN